MLRRWTLKTLLAAIIAVAPVFLASIPAAAATTPNGWVGACNMLQSWPGYGHVPAGRGMELAMSRDAAQGNTGMNKAVSVSGGSC